jgi:hypothetical protein
LRRRVLIIPSTIIAVLFAASVCTAQESSWTSFPSLQLSARQDTTRQTEGQDWSSDNIKELLAKETGEPDIEGTEWRRRKNPRIAMLCALAFPGLGQMYNERAFKAVIALGVETYYIMNIVHNCRKAQEWEKTRNGYDQYVDCPTGSCINPEWANANAWFEEYKERTIDWVWWTSAVILIVMLDAYVDAHLHDMQFRLESANVEGGTGLAVVVDF